jgi:F-type H+-transporting ATPase subunit alpha
MPQYQPLSLENQVMESQQARGFADNVPPDRMRSWESSLLRFLETTHPDIGKSIIEEKRITPEAEEKLLQVLETYMSTWH